MENEWKTKLIAKDLHFFQENFLTTPTEQGPGPLYYSFTLDGIIKIPSNHAEGVRITNTIEALKTHKKR